MTETTMLTCSFSKLGMDSKFIQQAERLGLFNLQDVLKARAVTLKNHRDFTFSWYAEMLALLQTHDLLSEFQENQL
jgi:hypothetical protein